MDMPVSMHAMDVDDVRAGSHDEDLVRYGCGTPQGSAIRVGQHAGNQPNLLQLKTTSGRLIVIFTKERPQWHSQQGMASGAVEGGYITLIEIDTAAGQGGPVSSFWTESFAISPGPVAGGPLVTFNGHV